MGISILLEDDALCEQARVGDPANILHGVLPDRHDAAFPLLGTVEWYADAYFNHDQMFPLREELQRLAARVETDDARALLRQIDALAERAANDRRLRICFLGD